MVQASGGELKCYDRKWWHLAKGRKLTGWTGLGTGRFEENGVVCNFGLLIAELNHFTSHSSQPMFCLPESFTLPYPTLATLFRPTAASPSSHCRVRLSSSAAVRPCSHCPQVSNSPALFFRELAPSPTLCIFLPSPSSSCRRLVGVVHQSRVCRRRLRRFKLE
ncbi:hypothetical protein S245_055655 [Arachis hypogaea]